MATAKVQGYRVTATYRGDKAAPWEGKGPANYNRHTVTVSRDGKRLSFDFWASLIEPEVRDTDGLKSAFACFLSDAIAGARSFEEFCSEFGYDPDSRRAERIHRACQKALAKAERMGLDLDGMCELANKLSE